MTSERESVWSAFPEARAVGHAIVWPVRHPRWLGAAALIVAAGWATTFGPPGYVAAFVAVALGVFAFTRPRRVVALAEIGPTPSPISYTLDRPRVWPPPALDPAGLEHTRVGTREDGQPWELGVLGSHILIVGETGAGKSSVIWSIMDGLGPYVRCGLAQVYAIDPKLGLELTIGRDLFARYEYTSWTAMANLLDDAVKVMQDRARRMAGVARKHVPTVDEPLIVVLVDEMSVLAEIKETKVRSQIAGALFTLLAQGRAAGVTVIGAVQDGRKERLADRHMFPTKIALRIERLQVDMILGDGARERGALCDQIPRSLPGTGYVMVDGGDPIRVRSYWNSDDDVRRIATLYGRAS